MRRFKQPAVLEEFKYVPFLPLKPVALLLASSVLVNYIFHERTVTQEVRIAWVWASLVTSIAMFGLIILIKKYLETKNGDEVLLTTYILGAATLGAMKGTASVALVSRQVADGVIDYTEFFIRGYSGASVAAGIAFTLALLARYRKDYLNLRLGIVEENQQLANDLVELRDEIMILRTASEEKLVQRVLENIDIRSGIDIFAEDPEKNWKKISEALNNEITVRVRRQSHELAQISAIEPSLKSRFREVLQLKVLHMHPKVFAFVQFSMGGAIYYSGFNLRNSVLLLALNTATTLIITTLIRDLFLKGKSESEPRNIAVFFVLIMTIDSIFALNQYLVWGYINPSLLIFIFLWHVFLVYFISGVSEVLQVMMRSKNLAQSVNTDLQDKWRVLSQYFVRLNSEIGKHLHGYLLARIHSVASNLDALAKAGEFEKYKVELEQLLSEFSLESIRNGLESHQITDQYFEALRQLWDGMVEVEFTGDLDFHATFQQVQTVELAGVIEELIANAHRHGGATHIEINFEQLADGDLKITAVDNGNGLTGKITRSLGSTIFDLASENRWSISNNPGKGARVELHITPYLTESAIRFPSGVPATFGQPEDQSP